MSKKLKDVDSDSVLVDLRTRYFALYAQENIGRTKKLTEALDKLESSIKERIKEVKKLQREKTKKAKESPEGI